MLLPAQVLHGDHTLSELDHGCSGVLLLVGSSQSGSRFSPRISA
jgi:hypothetical protein